MPDDPDKAYLAALVALREAEADYAKAETKLIKAQRAVQNARLGSSYYKMMHEHRLSNQK